MSKFEARAHLKVRAFTKQIAHAHHATVNDAVLAAVAGGLRQLLARRGEDTRGPRDGHLANGKPALRAGLPERRRESPGQRRDDAAVCGLPGGGARR